jgi:parallel beta-helix repeat protein
MTRAGIWRLLIASTGLLLGWATAIGRSSESPEATSGRKLVVPDDYSTVQAALAAAHAGDTVFLKTGTYHEAVDLKSGVKLLGEGIDKATLQFDGSRSVITAADCRDVTIAGLTVRHMTTARGSGGKAGIAVTGGTVVIEHCRVTQAAGTGIQIAKQATATINSCTLDENGDRGIEVTNSTAVIETCEVTRNKILGVGLVGQGTKATVRYCRIAGSKYAGLACWFGPSGTVEENDIQGNEVGIEVREIGVRMPGTRFEARDPNQGIVLRKNHCHRNGEDGIQIHAGGHARAEGNLCEQNAQRGIAVSGPMTTATLEKNQCRANRGPGICVWNEAGAELRQNYCEGNKTEGIYINATAAEIALTDNTCCNNGQAGIVIYDVAGGTVAYNHCQTNQRAGIYIRKTTAAITVSKNRCTYNHGHGILFGEQTEIAADNNACEGNNESGMRFYHGAHGLAQANRCDGNHAPGISVEDPNTIVTLRTNICCENNYSGILFLNTVAGEAEDNICLNNTWSGIAVRGEGAKPTLTANQCDNNGAWGIISWAGADPNVAADNQTHDNWKGGVEHRQMNPPDKTLARGI